jgi:hypothetical protein
MNFVTIGIQTGVSRQSVFNVVFGRRRSARVEAEIARILGKATWNEVVLEARSAVTRKPVEAALEEERARLQAQRKAQMESIGGLMAESRTKEGQLRIGSLRKAPKGAVKKLVSEAVAGTRAGKGGAG